MKSLVECELASNASGIKIHPQAGYLQRGGNTGIPNWPWRCGTCQPDANRMPQEYAMEYARIPQ